MFRAGLYARVSTNDQQTIPLQIRALREYAARRGWSVAMQVKKMVEAARRRDIDVVLVWRLDRWGRSVTDRLATSRWRQQSRDRPPSPDRADLGAPRSGDLFLAEIGQPAPLRRPAESSRTSTWRT